MEKQNKVAPGVGVGKEGVQSPSPSSLDNPKKAEPAFRIYKARETERYLNALFYGDYGVGKSYLAATSSEVPRMKSVLYINAEGGDASVEHFDIDLVDIGNYSQFARVHEFLRLHCKLRNLYAKNKDPEARTRLIKLQATFMGIEEESIKEPTLYYTVVVDTLTEVHKYCMYQLLGVKIGEFALDVAPDNPEIADWGRSAEMIRLLVRTFRDLPMNTIFICARDDVQDHTKKFHYAPLLPGKLSKEIRGFFDVVGYMAAVATEGGDMLRRLWLTPGNTFHAKHRFKDFQERYMDNPTMADLAKYRLKDLNEK
ncbi:MAG: hypothetical protein DDT19_00700 [Syntrophomonadaceae bacterium]|nr:hypothetical protein [Bacillota bacterium]